MRWFVASFVLLSACVPEPAPLSGDGEVGSPRDPASPVAFSGEVALPDGATLPEGAILRVEARSAKARGAIAQANVPTRDQKPPYPFLLRVRPGDDPVEIHASVVVDRRSTWTGPPARVGSAREPAAVGTIRLEPAPGAEGVGASAFRALGHEPSWSLDLTVEKLTFTELGAEPVTMAAPARTGGRRAIWAADGLRVEAVRGRCADVATGMPYPLVVSVIAGDRVFNGCGGDPASLLTGAPWTVTEIAGEAVDAAHAPTLVFGDDGRVSGTLPCNQYGAAYTIGGEGLAVRPDLGTKRPCDGPAGIAESAFLGFLDQITTFDVDAGGRLHLRAADGRALIASR